MTEEIPTGNLPIPKIPNVCDAMGFANRILRFIREQGWVFRRTLGLHMFVPLPVGRHARPIRASKPVINRGGADFVVMDRCFQAPQSS